MIATPIIHLSDFSKVFEITNASGVGIGKMLNQECHPLAYFSEKFRAKNRNEITNLNLRIIIEVACTTGGC